MKKHYSPLLKICLAIFLFAATGAPGQNEITIRPELTVLGRPSRYPFRLMGSAAKSLTF